MNITWLSLYVSRFFVFVNRIALGHLKYKLNLIALCGEDRSRQGEEIKHKYEIIKNEKTYIKFTDNILNWRVLIKIKRVFEKRI